MPSDKVAPITRLSPPLEELTIILLLQAQAPLFLPISLISAPGGTGTTEVPTMECIRPCRWGLNSSRWALGEEELFYHGFPYIWKSKSKHPTWINWKGNAGMEHIWEAFSWHGESLLLSSLEHHIPIEPSPGVRALLARCLEGLWVITQQTQNNPSDLRQDYFIFLSVNMITKYQPNNYRFSPLPCWFQLFLGACYWL